MWCLAILRAYPLGNTGGAAPAAGRSEREVGCVTLNKNGALRSTAVSLPLSKNSPCLFGDLKPSIILLSASVPPSGNRN